MRTIKFKPQTLADESFALCAMHETLWHRSSYRVLYADTDKAQIVNHANYLRYFEVGRSCLLRSLGRTYKDIESQGYVHPIVDLGLSYYRKLEYDDPMWIYTRPTRLRRVKLLFEYRILHGDTNDFVCSGHTEHACLNLKNIPVAVDPISVAMCEHFGVTGS